MSPVTLTYPLWGVEGLTRTYGFTQESVQTFQVLPMGQVRLVTQVLEVEHKVLPAAQEQAPHWSTYLPPFGAEQVAPTVEEAAVQPPQGYDAVLQAQLSVVQSNT
jgi:hypothetical protein